MSVRSATAGLVAAGVAVSTLALGGASATAVAETRPTWEPVLTLTSGSRGIDLVHTAVRPDGTYTVVWVEQGREDMPPDGWNNRVMAVDVTASGASEPVEIGGGPGSIIAEDYGVDGLDPETGGLQVATDGLGVTTVVWNEERTDGNGGLLWGSYVLEAHRQDDGEWSAPQQLSPERAWAPVLVTSHSGHALASWRSLSATLSAYRAPGGDWQDSIETLPFGYQHSIGIDDSGTALAASDGRAGVRIDRLRSGGSAWVRQTALGDRTFGPLDLAVNGAGAAVVAFAQSWGPPHGGGWGQVQAASKPAAARWRPVHPVSTPRRWAAPSPKVVLDGHGRAVATWVQGDDRIVKVASSSADGRWKRPVTIGTGARPVSGTPINLIADNRRGDTVVSWLVRRGGTARIDAAYRARGGRWLDVGLASPADTHPGRWGIQQAAAVVAAGGNVAMAWPAASGRRLYFRELRVEEP